MSLPALTLEANLDDNPTGPAFTWTDLTPYVLAWSFGRGRQMETNRIDAGTGSITFDNEDRRFDRNYAAGPYYGKLKRMRRVHWGLTWDGIYYPQFAGCVERWGQGGAIAVVPVVDGFAILSKTKLSKTYPEQISSDRVNAVLDDVKWGSGQAWVLGNATYGLLGSTTIVGPVGDRAVGEGNSRLQSSTLNQVDALAHLRDVEENEQGLLFMARDGSLAFHGRHRRISPPYTTSKCTFGPDDGELPYADLEMDDDTPLYNDIQLQRVGGTLQTASDATSQNEHYVSSYSKTDLILTSDSEVASMANWLLNRYKQEGTQIRSITLKPQASPNLMWPVVLGLELGDRVTVKVPPPFGIGDPIVQESYLEGIRFAAPEGGDWTIQLWFSPADAATYWILGLAGLGSATRIAY